MTLEEEALLLNRAETALALAGVVDHWWDALLGMGSLADLDTALRSMEPLVDRLRDDESNLARYYQRRDHG